MTKKISFLLGAGFSCPAGYPTASSLSGKIENKIKSFRTYAEQSTQRKLWTFYKFIKSMGSNAGFDYEWFYDSINVAKSSFAASENCEDVLSCNAKTSLCNCLAKQLKAKAIVCDDISPIRELYSLIIADYLYDECPNLDVECYRKFVSFLADIKANDTAVEIYSLNHDLLLERLLKNRHIEYADGYAYPTDKVIVYTDVGVTQKKVLAKVFDPRNFNSQINLCKLHGSLDTYWIGDILTGNKDLGYECSVKTNGCCHMQPDFSRWHKPYGCSWLMFDERMASSSCTPDFLTGKQSKLRDYNKKHYAVMFDMFLKNICESDAIVVIGYGFADLGINQILKQAQSNCRIVSICRDANARANDIFSKTLCDDFCDRKIITFPQLEDIDSDQIICFLNSAL